MQSRWVRRWILPAALAFFVRSQVSRGAASNTSLAGPDDHPPAAASAKAQVERGRSLYSRNCAHCHGHDAHGDEGPDLHDIKESDVRIRRIINQGIKGEMPKFNSKLSESDVNDLIAYLRSLRT